MNITLVGPQNAGKSTLFNALASRHVTTVNYPGSTVEHSESDLRKQFNLDINLSDTPGLSSLTPSTADQQVTVDYLFSDANRADHILAVIDATQLSRHLYLVDQLLDAGFQLTLCVSMLDLLKKNGQTLDLEALADTLGVPVFATNGRTLDGIPELVDYLRELRPLPEPMQVTPPEACSEGAVQSRHAKTRAVSERCIAGTLTTDVCSNRSIDATLLHPVWGLLIFIAAMVVIFTSIFSFAAPFMDAIDAATTVVVNWTKATLPSSWMTDIFADGILAGIGSVVICLPQIIILFLFMSYLEDSGYLARGAMLIDRPLSAIGLNGRSFVPLLSGFACAIPAMMAARTIHNRRERFLTLMIIPLMSCSARLPVYSLLITFLTDNPLHQGLVLAGMYFLSILLGTVVATILARTKAYKSKRGAFQLEMPVMRNPLMTVVLRSTFSRSMNYLRKAGPIIIFVSIGLWALTHLPVQTVAPGEDAEYVSVSESYASSIGHAIEPVMKPMGVDYRGGVALMMGFAAREVFVQSMALMYRLDKPEDDDPEHDRLLVGQMRNVTWEGTDQRIFTLSTVLGMLFFFSVALQCFPTVVVAKNETGQWRFALMQLFGYTILSYVGAVLIVQTLRLCGVA